MASDAEFQAVRDLFIDSDFTAAAICQRLEVSALPVHRTIRQGRTVALALNDPLDLLIRLFLDGEAVPMA